MKYVSAANEFREWIWLRFTIHLPTKTRATSVRGRSNKIITLLIKACHYADCGNRIMCCIAVNVSGDEQQELQVFARHLLWFIWCFYQIKFSTDLRYEMLIVSTVPGSCHHHHSSFSPSQAFGNVDRWLGWGGALNPVGHYDGFEIPPPRTPTKQYSLWWCCCEAVVIQVHGGLTLLKSY